MQQQNFDLKLGQLHNLMKADWNNAYHLPEAATIQRMQTQRLRKRDIPKRRVLLGSSKNYPQGFFCFSPCKGQSRGLDLDPSLRTAMVPMVHANSVQANTESLRLFCSRVSISVLLRLDSAKTSWRSTKGPRKIVCFNTIREVGSCSASWVGGL